MWEWFKHFAACSRAPKPPPPQFDKTLCSMIITYLPACGSLLHMIIIVLLYIMLQRSLTEFAALSQFPTGLRRTQRVS